MKRAAGGREREGGETEGRIISRVPLTQHHNQYHQISNMRSAASQRRGSGSQTGKKGAGRAEGEREGLIGREREGVIGRDRDRKESRYRETV